jgi:hypothetical protein
MALKDLFLKPVDRPIEGVIKADDEASLRLEVEEYVLTNEVSKRLEGFLAEYNHPENSNGVWVSGFFGSGKSHLLKMLALLLENRNLGGDDILSLFLPKCGDNELLQADLKRAVSIPSKSVLFNIDQKADVISKQEFDAVLAVFVKVFNEMRGYYGKLGHIARFERDLDRKGYLDSFNQAFESITGSSWVQERDASELYGDEIAQAFAIATGSSRDSAEGVIHRYREDYRVSIQDFAEEVKEYIDEQEPGFRLNFFVDEVGQYIGDSVKLMTNLQTIAESLATKSKGQAWIIVTAQEDMSTVVGEFGKHQSDDFSKIQARFAIRLKLTSQDVAEVIRKRLLTKNERGIAALSDLYQEQSNNFQTLFDFADGSQSYRNFNDRDEFIHSYPFIPYQYTLFQSCIQNLSKHNAFEGQHTAVGERSMLGVFQEVAKQIADKDVGQLATFDLMFEGIRTAVKAQVQQSILTAEHHLGSPFAVQVLKALFLVKYVREFKATLRNLSILLLPHFEASLPELRKEIEAALNLLETQTYIQRNGQLYDYLTDEEKDVESEIKNTSVDASEVTDELQKVIFDTIVGSNKIRYQDNGQDFPYARYLDEKLIGRDHELAIQVASPFHENAGEEDVIRAHSMGKNELLILLPLSERLIKDLRLYKQTDRYVRQNTTRTENDVVRRILTDKNVQNRSRKDAVKLHVSDLLAQATFVVGGSDLDLSANDPKERITQAFQQLVSRSYPNLRMLRGKQYRQEEVRDYLNPESTLFEGGADTVSEPEQEVLTKINLNARGGAQTTLQTLLSEFEKKPFGWHPNATVCMVAKLCSKGKLELKRQGIPLEGTGLESVLTSSRDHSHIVLAPQEEFAASALINLKRFYNEMFDGPPNGQDPRSLATETSQALDALHQKMGAYLDQSDQYPFMSELKDRFDIFSDVVSQPYSFYLKELNPYTNDLLELKEDVIDPLKQFMNGPAKRVYQKARQMVGRNASNMDHIDGDEATRITALLQDVGCVTSNLTAELGNLATALESKVSERRVAVIDHAVRGIESYKSKLRSVPAYSELSATQQDAIDAEVDAVVNAVKAQSLIAVVNDRLARFTSEDYPGLLARIDRLTAPPPPPKPVKPDWDEDEPPVVVVKEPTYINKSAIRVPFSHAVIETESHVDDYVEALRTAMNKAISEGKKITP